jgi:hypothetical protein
VGEHVLRQPNEFDAAFDPDPLLLDRRAQDALGLGLRNEQEVVIAAVDPREVEAKGALASTIEAGGKAGVAKPDHLVRQAAQLEQLQRARLHPDGTGSRCGRGLLVDNAQRDAETGQFQRGRQSGRSGANDQDGFGHDCCSSFMPAIKSANKLRDPPTISNRQELCRITASTPKL